MALKRKNCFVQEIEYGACVADGALVAPSAFVADDASTDVEADDESTDVEEFVPPVQKGIKRSATLSVLDERFAAEIESDDVKSKRHFGNCLCVQNATPPPTPFPKPMVVYEEEGLFARKWARLLAQFFPRICQVIQHHLLNCLHQHPLHLPLHLLNCLHQPRICPVLRHHLLNCLHRQVRHRPQVPVF
jgi:hypothetical protein